MKICRNVSDLALAFAEARALVEQRKEVAVTVKEHSNRSLDQNALFHEWMLQAAMINPQHDAAGWKAHCKLHHGVPILRAEDADFRAVYDAGIKHLTYEQKIATMAYLPVTSIMTRPQMSRFMDAVKSELANEGIFLQ